MGDYKLGFSGEEINEILAKVNEGDLDITVDTELSTTSTNAIANSTVTNALSDKVDAEQVSSTTSTVAFPQVLYTAQTLSESQQSQARTNIYAMPATPSGDPMHYAYEACGAVWNAATGFWVLNELTDISKAEMRAIYAERYNSIGPKQFEARYRGSSQRTNISMCKWWSVGSVAEVATGCAKIETFAFSADSTPALPASLAYSFRGCSKLRKLIGTINANYCTTTSEAFMNCTNLEEIRIQKLKANISFADSPLSVESAIYMLENADSSATFTITFRADRRAVYEANTDFVAARDAKTNITIMYN